MVSALKLFLRHFTPPIPPNGGGLCIASTTGSANAFLATALTSLGNHDRKRPSIVLAVTPGLPDADRLADDLTIVTARMPVRVMEYPPAIPDDKGALGTRLKTIAALKAWETRPYPAVIVAPFQALRSSVPQGSVPMISLGAEPVRFADLCQKIAAFGYNRVPTVEQEGDWSVRGGILDVWSPGEEFPIRAEFFGDDMESLRTFDAATQLSISRIATTRLLPVTDGDAPHDDDRHRFTILDLLPEGTWLLAEGHNAYHLPVLPPTLRALYVGDPAPMGIPTYEFLTTALPGFAELGAEAAHHPEFFAAAQQRLNRHLETARLRGSAVVAEDGLSGGFEIAAADGKPGLLIVTKADRVFAKRRTRPSRSVSRGERLNDFDELEPGEYVVHIDHGVGRFLGSSEILVGNRRCEVFTIEYADGAKLHVPSSHAHMLSRYVGVKGETVRLHRLDGKKWTKDKANAQRAVADLAAVLLETQAKRDTTPGFAYDLACEGLESFESAFPYEETPDQLAAISAVKNDLAQRKPMDRLICGDAGYGKTEVAMRAAYIAAMNGKQTAVLAPTTVLAEQHFETFTSRFDGTPIRIESLSRFQSSATHRGTFDRIASGACDIVIGTHALLSKKTVFHDLGLIVIDEEQRFGVQHKEFLKRLRATADILTLSATPIPRTLYLSMTGARDLSLLRTPPRVRVAVETKIVRDSDTVIRAAIEAELMRGGQVFFLHNRVSTIGGVERRLHELMPQLRIVVAHGQMDAPSLARKMRDFEQGKADLLLSTTIIESGIDIPRANTILVDRADTFGLADLYQLRGRVGRSSHQGRALMLLPPSGDVDSDARERLDALQRHGGLGAGFDLAVRDLELRGAGNLLGSQQSGHIAAVGFALYCQLLQRTIAIMRGEKVHEIVEVRLNLDFIDPSPASSDLEAAAAIPYAYVEEDAQRMTFLRRFAEAQDASSLKTIVAELTDRFGPLPAAARRLVKLTELRIRCAAHRIDRIDAAGTRAVFYRFGSHEIAFVTDLRGKTADRKLAELAAAVKQRR